MRSLGSVTRGSDGLQRQARGEDPLDHVVVQVAGDAVAVLVDVELAGEPLPGGHVQGDGGLVGEGGDQRADGAVEGGARRPAGRRCTTALPASVPRSGMPRQGPQSMPVGRSYGEAAEVEGDDAAGASTASSTGSPRR